VIVLRAAAAAAVLLAAVACGSQPSMPAADEKPDTVALGSRWPYHFTSLEELVATSDLVVVGEVTAIERGRVQPDPDPASRIGLRDATLTVFETLKGTVPGAAVVIEESAYDGDGSFEYEDMPWSQLGDVGVFFLTHSTGQPADRFRQIHPDGRILTHYRGDDGESHMYDGTVEMFSHTQLGSTLTELAPDSAAEHVRQAVVHVAIEQIEPQQPFHEILAEVDPDNATSGTDNTSPGDRGNTGGHSGTGPVDPDGTSTTPSDTTATPNDDEEATE